MHRWKAGGSLLVKICRPHGSCERYIAVGNGRTTPDFVSPVEPRLQSKATCKQSRLESTCLQRCNSPSCTSTKATDFGSLARKKTASVTSAIVVGLSKLLARHCSICQCTITTSCSAIALGTVGAGCVAHILSSTLCDWWQTSGQPFKSSEVRAKIGNLVSDPPLRYGLFSDQSRILKLCLYPRPMSVCS